MLEVSTKLILGSAVLLTFYYWFTKMAKAGSPLFKIGYCLYTKTRIGHYYYRREIAKAREKYGTKSHSIADALEFDGLRILPIAISMDNFSYLITDMRNKVSVLIDPADPDPVMQVVEKENAEIVAVLTTHKHWDHAGGNNELRKRLRGLVVYGGDIDRPPGCNRFLQDKQVAQFGDLIFTAFSTPGHTVGHTVYCLDGSSFNAPSSLFSGDHLFLGGMGRMFEGSAMTMLQSLDSLAQLPADTLVWPGHEYALDNLTFAVHLDPDNEAAKNKLESVKESRKKQLATCPSNLGEEREYNPFLRTSQRYLQELLGVKDSSTDEEEKRAKALAEIRKRKDKFNYKL